MYCCFLPTISRNKLRITTISCSLQCKKHYYICVKNYFRILTSENSRSGTIFYSFVGITSNGIQPPCMYRKQYYSCSKGALNLSTWISPGYLWHLWRTRHGKHFTIQNAIWYILHVKEAVLFITVGEHIDILLHRYLFHETIKYESINWCCTMCIIIYIIDLNWDKIRDFDVASAWLDVASAWLNEMQR